jgi:hypothetical protein
MLGILFCLLLACPARADEGIAVLVGTYPQNSGHKPPSETITLTIKGNKVRQVEKNTPTIKIARPDQNRLWTLFPQEKRCVYGPLLLSQLVPLRMADGQTIIKYYRSLSFTSKKVGRESIGNYLCDKYELTSKRSQWRVTLWLSKQVPVPVKIVEKTLNKLHGTIELRSFRRVSVPDSQFDMPKGWRRSRIPMGWARM